MAMWRLDCRVQSIAHSGVGRPVKRRLQMETMVAWTGVIMADRRSCQTLDTFWRQSQQGLLMNWVKNMGERNESRRLSAAWPEHLEGWRWPNVIHREQADNKGITQSDSPSFNNASVETWEHKDDSPSMWVVNTLSVQSLSRVRLFATPWIAARQASLSITSSRSSLTLTSIESVMPSSHLILLRPLFLLPPIPPSIRVFPMSQLFAWGGQSTGVSALAPFLPKKSQGWSPKPKKNQLELHSTVLNAHSTPSVFFGSEIRRYGG